MGTDKRYPRRLRRSESTLGINLEIHDSVFVE